MTLFGHAKDMVASHEPSFSHLLSQAEALAARQHESLRGVHLLAALGASAGRVQEALTEQRAGFRRVLDEWACKSYEVVDENFFLFRRRVVEKARSMGSRAPDATHVLLALLDDTRGSARLVLAGLAVDVSVLRTRASQIGKGLSPQLGIDPGFERSVPRGQVVPVMTREERREPAAPSRNDAVISSANSRERGRGRRSGQALSVIPQVGPTPLPGLRAHGRSLDAEEVANSEPTFHESLGEGMRMLGGFEPSLESSGEEHTPIGEGDTCSFSEAERDALLLEYGLSKKRYPILTTVGRNLSLAAALGDSDPVVGRQDEVEQALDILAKRQGNNPCLIGAAGVGKTSVARGIADAIVRSHDDERLVIEIPISELVAGTGMRGALAGRLNALKKEVKATEGRVVLFFDEIHQLFSGDAAEEIASDLKLCLARGDLPCIGATSADEYRRVIEADATLSRCFSTVEVDEPNREDAFLILSSLVPRLIRHHGVRYDEEALSLSIAWSVRYLPGRCLPDKAVGILDLAGARTRRRRSERVDPEAVAQVIASQANMPLERLMESDADRMLHLGQSLCERVIGHEEHLLKMARILRRNAAGIGGRRPIGTFLLLGPTGVGKTETAKAIAEALFHDESAMTRIDMAEMSEAHSVAKLVGAPPGYVGHDAGGRLTEAVRQRPYQVVLLDEIEKAHPEVLTAFLAVFDEGRLTDSRGRLVDFTNTVIILTSNLGSREISSASRKRVGFSSGDAAPIDVTQLVQTAARRALAPELYNRIDEVLAFAPLTRPDLQRIGRKMCQGLADQVELSRGISLVVDDLAIDLLLDQGGFEPELGARPLRRMLSRLIEAPLSEAILSGDLKAGDAWLIGAQEGELCFEIDGRASLGAAE